MIFQPSVSGRGREHPKPAKATTTDCRTLRATAVEHEAQPLPEAKRLAMKIESALAPKTAPRPDGSVTGQFLLRGSWEVLFKPGSPHWLLPFCNARCIVAKEEKPHGQECHPAHRQGEEVREARRGLV
jgi:hypothetical protein